MKLIRVIGSPSSCRKRAEGWEEGLVVDDKAGDGLVVRGAQPCHGVPSRGRGEAEFAAGRGLHRPPFK